MKRIFFLLIFLSACATKKENIVKEIASDAHKIELINPIAAALLLKTQVGGENVNLSLAESHTYPESFEYDQDFDSKISNSLINGLQYRVNVWNSLIKEFEAKWENKRKVQTPAGEIRIIIDERPGINYQIKQECNFETNPEGWACKQKLINLKTGEIEAFSDSPIVVR